MNNLLQKYESHINFLKNGSTEEAHNNFTNEYLDQYDIYGLKPIHWACMSFNVDILKLLLEKKCDIETPSKTGWKPIHFATFYGDEKIIKFLIGKYCKLDCKTNNGETVLDVASCNCDHKFIDEILTKTNMRIGLSMGLKCSRDCCHKFCLKSLIRCNFSKEKLIREGFSTWIYEIEDLQNNRKFVVKTIREYSLFVKSRLILPNLNQILPKLKHSKIIQYYGVIETPTNELNVFMELMVKGTLDDEIQSIKVIDIKNIGRYCRDILQAVAFLHQNKFLHGNINSRKILIDMNGGCKLAISMSSCSMRDDNDKLDTFYWIPIYQAPEILSNRSWSYPFDIWSIGCTVIHMLTVQYLSTVIVSPGFINERYITPTVDHQTVIILIQPLRGTSMIIVKDRFFI